jgi:hypothetical protein
LQLLDNGTNLVLLTSTGIYYSSNGTSWSACTFPNLANIANGIFTGFVVGTNFYLVTPAQASASSPVVHAVFRSTSGTTFSPWGTLGPTHASSGSPTLVAVLPNNHIVMGTHQTMYVSKNLGKTFQSIALGVENTLTTSSTSANRYNGCYGLAAIWLPGGTGTALGKIAFSATNFNVPQSPDDGSSAWIKSA